MRIYSIRIDEFNLYELSKKHLDFICAHQIRLTPKLLFFFKSNKLQLQIAF